jgi:hypothetical protein
VVIKIRIAYLVKRISRVEILRFAQDDKGRFGMTKGASGWHWGEGDFGGVGLSHGGCILSL